MFTFYYFTCQQSNYKGKMNSGERNEILVQLKLVEIRDSGNPFIRDLKIFNVGYNEEYRSLPTKFNMGNINELSDVELERVANSIGICKAGPYSKADVYINKSGYSLKSLETAPPALVNHTTRSGIMKVCNRIGLCIDDLDNMVDEYWDKRMAGVLKEDVKNNDKLSPFSKNKKYLTPILQYFLFDGSGSKDSNDPAKYVLDFQKPSEICTWKIYDKYNIIDYIWDKLVFSIRSKGMPPDYPAISKDKLSEIQPWVKKKDGSYKGSLHIRLGS